MPPSRDTLDPDTLRANNLPRTEISVDGSQGGGTACLPWGPWRPRSRGRCPLGALHL